MPDGRAIYHYQITATTTEEYYLMKSYMYILGTPVKTYINCSSKFLVIVISFLSEQLLSNRCSGFLVMYSRTYMNISVYTHYVVKGLFTSLIICSVQLIAIFQIGEQNSHVQSICQIVTRDFLQSYLSKNNKGSNKIFIFAKKRCIPKGLAFFIYIKNLHTNYR